MSRKEFIQKSRMLRKFFGEDAVEEAKRSGFVERKSKMGGSEFAQTVVLGWMDNSDASLNDLVQCSAELGVEISEPGLHQRLDESAVAFLKGLLACGLQNLRAETRLPEEVLKHFSQVNLLDSTYIALPDALHTHFAGKGGRGGVVAAVKVQLSLDYLTGNLNAIELEAGREPDQNCRLHLAHAKPNSLHVFDLGYYKQGVFEQLDKAQAYFVSRLQTQTALYWGADDEQPLDLVAFLKGRGSKLGETRVYLGATTRLPVRLIYARLPKAVVAERRRQAQLKASEQGKTCSKHHLALLAWGLFITNTPIDWLTPEQVLVVYRIRWQIEIIFKVWKSQAKIERIGDFRIERILCQLYARLIGVMLFHWSIAPWRVDNTSELSLPRAFRIMQRYALRLVEAISTDGHKLSHVLEKMTEDFLRFARKNSRRKSPSTYSLLVHSGA
jgi:hypothetical protein